MDSNNVRKVNKLMSTALLYCAIPLVLLLLTIPFGIYNFSPFIIKTIIFAGIPATVFPAIMYRLHFPEGFLKSYMLIALGILVGLLGTQNGIGIYITYILVPIASSLYINKRFTAFISAICYFVMAAGVYFNCAGKMEVTYKGWSHLLTYRNYMIGFTIEYTVVVLFTMISVSRAQHFMEIQITNYKMQKLENEKQKKITDFYLNALSSQKTTVFNAISSKMDSFVTEDYLKMAAGHRFASTIQDMINSSDDDSVAMHNAFSSIGEYFGLVRILYIEPESETNKTNKLSYSWALKEKYQLQSFYSQFDEEDYRIISSEYDRQGYIQLIPYDSTSQKTLKNIECGLTKYVASIALGTQLWMPTLSGGTYHGAMCFEKNDDTEFKVVDILILSLYVNSNNAERANKAKSAFLSTMSHEIRTPMNAILGMTTVALRQDMNETVRNSLNIIKSSSEGLLGIINDILDFSKIESGKFEIINAEYSIESLINDVKAIIESRNNEKGLDLSFHIDENFPAVLIGDMIRIKQIMVNLATNAIKYTDEGSVKIELTFSECSTSSIIMKYIVTDTGQGIKDEDKDKLFTSFSQVNQTINHHKEGTGLGLAISKQLATLMNGYIGFESKYGEGSKFYFEIPQTIAEHSNDEVHAENSDEQIITAEDNSDDEFTAPDANILIVDDNEINRMVAESMFEIYEMNISQADGGYSAIDICKQKKFDIIFMDHFMPDLDGISATRAIRDDIDNPNHDTVIIALTADAMSDSKEQMLAAGMNDFLSKPIDMDKCTMLLRKYLKK